MAEMLPTIIVGVYLAIVLYIGIFAFRRGKAASSEDYFLASRSLGPWVFLLSLFGTNMTAFAILGSSGMAYQRGIGVYGLMASSSSLIIPLTILIVGTRLWALGKRFGHMTQVQYLRDRWQCNVLGTALFVLTAAMLVPYIVIGVMGGGEVMEALSMRDVAVVKNGVTSTVREPLIGYSLGGAIVALVVMSYVFFGGMRGTAWVNSFQTILFLCFGSIAFIFISKSLGGFDAIMQKMSVDPKLGSLLQRQPRIGKEEFFSYMFIPLSAIMFPHIAIMCMTAEKIGHFKKTVIAYPLCIMAIWLPSVFLGVIAASQFPGLSEGQANDVILRMLQTHTPTLMAGILGAGIMACVMASDSQILALGTMFTQDIVVHYTKGADGKSRLADSTVAWTGRLFVVAIGVVSWLVAVALKDKEGIFELAIRFAFTGFAALAPVMIAALFWKRSTATAAFMAVVWVAATMIGTWVLQSHSDAFAPKPGQAPVAIFQSLGGMFLRGPKTVTIFGYLPVMPMCLGSALIMVIGSLITKPPAQHIIDKYFPPKPTPGAVAA